MQDTFVLIVSFFTFVFICVLVKSTNLITIRRLPNGPFGLPILGHLHLIGTNPSAKFMEWRKLYGNVFCIRIGRWNTVVVNGYKAVKATVEKMKGADVERPNFLSNQIFVEMNSGSERKFSNSPCDERYDTEISLCLLTTNRSDHIEELVAQEASVFVDDLLKKYKPVPRCIQSDVQRLAARIIFQLLYGHDNRIHIERHLNVIINSSQITDDYLRSLVDFLPWLRYIMPEKVDILRQSVSKVHDMISHQLHSHYKTFNKDHIRDLTDALLATVKYVADKKETPRFTDQRVQKTLLDLQRLGFDTMDKTLAWLLLYMTKYPDVQERVHTEIDDLIGRRRKIELKDKPGLVYTNAVILEVMRITSVMPFSLPYCTRKDIKIEGFDVAKGTIILFNLHAIHHDKQFWGDPESFRPERFIIQDHILDAHKCSHIVPFGLGRRRCVGEHLAKITVFIAFATVMQKSRFVCPSDENLDLEPNPGFMYSPKNHKILIEERF